MENIAALTVEFARNFGKAIRTLRAYSPAHRQAQVALQEAFGTLRRMLENQPSVLLGTREGTLIFQGKPLRDMTPATQGFCEMLAARSIATFAVEQGVTAEEFGHLVKILSMNPEDLLEGQVIKPEHLRPLHHIHVNEMRFVAVQGDAPEGEGGTITLGGASTGNLTLLLNSLLAGAAGAGEAPEGGGAAQLQALGAAMQPLTDAAQKNEAVQVASRNFDQIVEQAMRNVPAAQFVENYLKGVGSLPEALKRAILQTTGAQERAAEPEAMIERLPLAMRGRILAEDIGRGGTDPARLRQVLRQLAPSAADSVQLLEIVQRLLVESADTAFEAERKVADLHGLLPLSDELRRPRPSVFLLVRDRSALADGARALEAAGFAVTARSHPDPNLPALVQARALDALVVDIGPYRLGQLEFLKELQALPSLPPLILIDDVLTVRESSEMELCSRGDVQYKPLEPQRLAQILRETVPAVGEAPPPPAAEEVDSARRIQRELVPREFPAIPGYSFAARFEPGSGEGGDYHDVLPLSGGRAGLFLLDASGSRAGILSALLAARTEFQRISFEAGDPAEALARLNDRVTGRIPRGTFIGALYAVLDTATGRLSVAAGGYPRPVRWEPRSPRVRLLQTTGAPLGLVKGADFRKTLHPATVALAPGDHVLFHTLGVTHATGPKGEEFGERGIARVILTVPEGPAGVALVEVVEAVLRQGDGAGGFTLLELCRERGAEESRVS